MRYKFRVWNEELEEMYTISKEKYLGSTGIVDPYVGHEKAVWLQFTGLTDVNNRKIYEGDIIRYKWGSDEDYYVESIKWDEYYTGYHPYLDDYSMPNKNTVEVIGNIYQHKHLLKENGI